VGNIPEYLNNAQMSKTVIDRAADNIRLLSASMVEKAKSGHPGGAMGGADFMNILFTEFLVYDPSDMLVRPIQRFVFFWILVTCHQCYTQLLL